ncbi:MAG TPA: hypothetical protein VFS96_04660 [Nitrolancea sp.]|nr:hypothetical protein [Nitrolancea sp.]
MSQEPQAAEGTREPTSPDEVAEQAKNRVLEQIATSLIESLIIDGHIDPLGKTQAMVAEEARKIFAELLDSEKLPLELRIIHEDRLLEEARRFVEQDDLNFALMFYATWFEHRLNFLLDWRGRKLGLDSQQCIQLIRTANMNDKVGLTWRLLMGSEIDPQVASSVRKVAELRNTFVHYKWPSQPVDDSVGETPNLKDVVELAEDAVRRLDAFRKREVMRGFTAKNARPQTGASVQIDES